MCDFCSGFVLKAHSAHLSCLYVDISNTMKNVTIFPNIGETNIKLTVAVQLFGCYNLNMQAYAKYNRRIFLSCAFFWHDSPWTWFEMFHAQQKLFEMVLLK